MSCKCEELMDEISDLKRRGEVEELNAKYHMRRADRLAAECARYLTRIEGLVNVVVLLGLEIGANDE
jgi:hypothetical protein